MLNWRIMATSIVGGLALSVVVYASNRNLELEREITAVKTRVEAAEKATIAKIEANAAASVARNKATEAASRTMYASSAKLADERFQIIQKQLDRIARTLNRLAERP